MNEARRRYWRSQVLGGYGSFGPGTKATLKIGRKAGLTYSGWREGDAISKASVGASVAARRGKQVEKYGYNITDTAGSYKGQKEPSASVELAWIPGDNKNENTRAAFFRNVKRLAQEVAHDLAQREVLVEWDAPGRRGRVDSASPVKAPSPTNRPDFCDWVREHSRSAKKNRSDDCHESKFTKKKGRTK